MELKLYNSPDLIQRDRALLDAFQHNIYDPAFPDIDEKEPFDIILKRVQNPEQVKTIIVLGLDGPEVCAGLVADWYEECRSLEIIYIAVAPEHCRKGLGRDILKKGTKEICDLLEKNNQKVKYVFAEVENPFKPLHPTGNIDPISRLRFFGKEGAKRVPISYVQPPLSFDQGYADNLFLICFPSFTSTPSECIPADDLISFLNFFYDGLKDFASGDPDEFESTRNKLIKQVEDASDYNGNVVLDHLLEEPSFYISKASIGSHYLISGVAPDGPLARLKKDYCPNFDSYESDLLNYHHQTKHRPLYTHHTLLKENVKIYIPKCYQYSSEGLTYFRLCNREFINVHVSLNWSYNALSDTYMAHLVLGTAYNEEADVFAKKDKDNEFSDLDFIRFVTGFGSRQENYSCIADDDLQYHSFDGWSCFSIQIGEGEKTPIIDWMKQVLDPNADYVYQGTGFSEINLASLTDVDQSTVFQSFDDFSSKILDNYGPDADFLWNKAFCGVILGIFDYNRMMSSEIYDTVRPIAKRKESFALISRGHLHEISYSTDLENNSDEDIIASPYILIPSAALSFNENLLNENTTLLDKVYAQERQFAKDRFKKSDNAFYSRSRELQIILKIVNKSLNDEYLSDIFQYISEREILDTGSKERGLTYEFENLEKRIEDLKDTRDSYIAEYKNGFEMNQNMFLLVLAILQVVTAILSGSQWWIILAISLSLLLPFFLLGRIIIRKNRKD